MKRFQFHLSVSSEELLAYYRGAAQQVLVTCFDGLVIQFPASLLKTVVTRDGVHGDFSLTCDENNKGAMLLRSPGR